MGKGTERLGGLERKGRREDNPPQWVDPKFPSVFFPFLSFLCCTWMMSMLFSRGYLRFCCFFSLEESPLGIDRQG